MKTLLSLILAFTVSVGMAQTISDPNNSLLGLSPKYDHSALLDSVRFRYTTIGSEIKPLRYIFFNTPSEIMSISAPDSTRTITVKFSRKQVKFINDSTFTFKLK